MAAPIGPRFIKYYTLSSAAQDYLLLCNALLCHEDLFFRLLVVHEIRRKISMNETKH